MIRKFRAAASEMGAFNAVLYTLNRVFNHVGTRFRVYRYYLVAQPVQKEPRIPTRGARSFTVREIGRSDPALQTMPLTPAVLEYRFRQPTICLGTFKERELVAYVWLCLGPYEEDEVRCRFVPSPVGKAVWDFDVFVFPKHRMGRAFSRLWDEADAFLRERNYSWSVSRISAFNPASLTSHQRLGARRLGSALFLRGRHVQLMLSNLPPYVNLSLTRAKRAELRVFADS